MSSPGRTSPSSGFTLIEVLAVLLVLAAAMTITVPRVARMMEGLSSRRDVGDLVFLFRRARVEAVERGSTIRVALAEGTIVVGTEDGEAPIISFTVPPGLILPEGSLDPGVEFYPLGNSSGWSGTVTSGGVAYRVTVDPLTGDVASGPAPDET